MKQFRVQISSDHRMEEGASFQPVGRFPDRLQQTGESIPGCMYVGDRIAITLRHPQGNGQSGTTTFNRSPEAAFSFGNH